mmetsp:Transcript_55488/g.130250  ORF Transcript_55488/g.130250 Transcript_55488/m.130250 type:complete len:211 (-) Transcript_55488:2958-3590(-)
MRGFRAQKEVPADVGGEHAQETEVQDLGAPRRELHENYVLARPLPLRYEEIGQGHSWAHVSSRGRCGWHNSSQMQGAPERQEAGNQQLQGLHLAVHWHRRCPDRPREVPRAVGGCHDSFRWPVSTGVFREQHRNNKRRDPCCPRRGSTRRGHHPEGQQAKQRRDGSEAVPCAKLLVGVRERADREPIFRLTDKGNHDSQAVKIRVELRDS